MQKFRLFSSICIGWTGNVRLFCVDGLLESTKWCQYHLWNDFYLVLSETLLHVHKWLVFPPESGPNHDRFCFYFMLWWSVSFHVLEYVVLRIIFINNLTCDHQSRWSDFIFDIIVIIFSNWKIMYLCNNICFFFSLVTRINDFVGR